VGVIRVHVQDEAQPVREQGKRESSSPSPGRRLLGVRQQVVVVNPAVDGRSLASAESLNSEGQPNSVLLEKDLRF